MNMLEMYPGAAAIVIRRYGNYINEIPNNTAALARWIRRNVAPPYGSIPLGERDVLKQELQLDSLMEIARQQHYTFKGI